MSEKTEVFVAVEYDGSKWVSFEDFTRLKAERDGLKCCGNCGLWGALDCPNKKFGIHTAGDECCNNWQLEEQGE